MRFGFWREQRQRQKDKVAAASPGHALDRDLATRIGKGDREALIMWLDRHAGPVHSYLVRRLGPGNEKLAAEVTRATFKSAMRHLTPYSRGTTQTPMRLWLIRRAGDHLARKRSSVEPPSSQLGESPQLVRLREAMSAIPSRKEAALALAIFEGMSAPEIAEALGTSQGRAMRMLRSALRSVGPTVVGSGEEKRHRG
jgi:RNA polymerase sigma factor (sigma-70 family)